MDNPEKVDIPENLSVWSCNPKDIPQWTDDDIARLHAVLEKYIFEPNRAASSEKVYTDKD